MSDPVKEVKPVAKVMAADCVNPHLMNLHFTGYWCLDERKYGETAHNIHRIYTELIFFMVSMHNCQETASAAVVYYDLDKLVTASFILLTHIDAWTKLLVFRVRRSRVQDLFDSLNDPLFNQSTDDRFEPLKAETARTARVLMRWYTGAAFATCILWATFPLIDKLTGHGAELPLIFPFKTDYSPCFEICLFYILCMNSLEGYSNTTMDAIVSTVMAQCKTQMTILKWNLESLPVTAYEEWKTVGDCSYEKTLNRRFLMCLRHYKLIIDISSELNDIFSVVILFQFGVSGWIICMTAYKITDIDPMTIEFASAVLYMICLLIELFIYCYYGNELTVESDSIIESVYKMDWLSTPIPFQKSLLILMERAKRPIRPVAGLIVPLSMGTFMTILKSSYTFYAVLKGTK